MKPAYVRGIGLWTPGFADAEAWCAGTRSDDSSGPEAKLLDGAIRRRATSLTRMAIEALQQAAERGRCDLRTVPTIWASAHGEHETGVALLEMMHRDEGRLSPTRFHNSVYNTASGYASIASGNQAFSTTLSGGPELVGSALLEACCLLHGGAREVIVVLADEPMGPPFDHPGVRTPLAVAMCLAADPAGAAARIEVPRREGSQGCAPRPEFGALYLSAVLPLVECIAAARSGRVPLELDLGANDAVWSTEVTSGSR